ncbi:imidazole glycerol phosphate synthase subunit HisF [Nonlabens xiamenensis]|uniref:imidazole glycerol phosphate synthase subunit HisF n=1 Tax=Nonlabens xiamenensis TaxID=2341043 RepID=UPI000F60F59E|nr:imidazole glycerol phosphate synthase subunit HisF [Nonlabens xiamenensis]
MLKKRIIPCLDIKDGRTVKGINFVGLRDAGDPVQLARQYAQQGADELCFLDITATVEKRETLIPLVKDIAAVLNIPFTVGGGINDVRLAKEIIKAGADKVAVNSAAVKRPELINELAQELGNQCVVVAVDTKRLEKSASNPPQMQKTKKETESGYQNTVFVGGGRYETDKETIAWCKECETRGAGEILLTSMDHDGTKNGFALEITERIADQLSIPVIASGGGGNTVHFVDLFSKTQASAGLAASIFHFGELPVPQLKRELEATGIAVRLIASS